MSMKLKAAVEALYRAGRWTCGLPAAEEARLWEQVRDAAEIAPGTETARNDRAPAQGESAPPQCAPPQSAPTQWENARPQVALPLAGPSQNLAAALRAGGLEVHGTTCRTDGYTVDVVRGGVSALAHGATLREAVQKACAALGVKVTWWVELEWVGFRDGWRDALKAAGVEARLESNGIFHASARRGDLVGTGKALWASVALEEACRNCGVEIRWKNMPEDSLSAGGRPPASPPQSNESGGVGPPQSHESRGPTVFGMRGGVAEGLREVRQEIAELRRALSASVGAIQQAVSGSPDPCWERVAELLRRIDQDGQATIDRGTDAHGALKTLRALDGLRRAVTPHARLQTFADAVRASVVDWEAGKVSAQPDAAWAQVIGAPGLSFAAAEIRGHLRALEEA